MTKGKQTSPGRQSAQSPKPGPDPSVSVSSQQWSGPLPPPGALAQFNEIIPNGAERILKLVEQEQDHRISYESKSIEAAVRDTKRGHVIGGIISILAVCGAIFTAYIGAHPAVSIALVGLPIFGIVQAFIRNKG